MKTQTAVLIALVALASVSTGCRRKAAPQPVRPPLDVPVTDHDLGMLCSGAKKGFADARGYSKHADGSPSGVVAFQQGEKSSEPGYRAVDLSTLAPFKTSIANVELTACVDMLDMSKESPAYCSYWGASVTLQGRGFHVRVLETKTGNVLADETFETTKRTASCPSSTRGSQSLYVSPDRRVLAMLAPLEPEAKLPPATVEDLRDVCAGTGVPQAADGDSGSVDVVYFRGKDASWTNDLPLGMNFPERHEPTAVSQFSRVLCVTQVPQKLVQSCSFTGGKVLDVYSGVFETELRDARTARILETRSFTGSGGSCPTFHDFWGARDTTIGTMDKSYEGYLFGLSPWGGAAHSTGTMPKSRPGAVARAETPSAPPSEPY